MSNPTRTGMHVSLGLATYPVHRNNSLQRHLLSSPAASISTRPVDGVAIVKVVTRSTDGVHHCYTTDIMHTTAVTATPLTYCLLLQLLLLHWHTAYYCCYCCSTDILLCTTAATAALLTYCLLLLLVHVTATLLTYCLLLLLLLLYWHTAYYCSLLTYCLLLQLLLPLAYCLLLKLLLPLTYCLLLQLLLHHWHTAYYFC